MAEEQRLTSGARSLQRRHVDGELVRVRTGAYVDAAAWHRLEYDQRELLRVAAVVGSRRGGGILFGESAALVLGLPLVGRPGGRVHLLSGSSSAPPNGRDVVWHRNAVPSSSIIEVDGFLVTDVERTLLDVARSVPFLDAISALDRGIRPRFTTAGVRFEDGSLRWTDARVLAGASREQLIESLARSSGTRGVALARRTIEFADSRAGSPGESISRAQIHVQGFPAPVLQAEFVHDDGVDITDFDWPDFGICGEFDGKVKYFREEFLGDLTPNEVVWRERERERRIKRGHGRDMARWIWSDSTRDGMGLRDELRSAGLPRVR
ncbi:hypothetical protein [Agromyces bauzanensis]